MKPKLAISLGLFSSILFVGSFSFAVLGEHQSKIPQAEKVQLKAKTHVSKAAVNSGVNYTVNELDLDGILVKEYADNAGMVFAVSWQGMKPPDLSVIFGSYYSGYKTEREKQNRRKGQRMVHVDSGSVVVTQGGHMRDIHGFAYVPSLVPAGLDLGSLQ